MNCILNQSKTCDHCGDCDNRCQLDPTKLCDNCFRCLDDPNQKDYADIEITDILTNLDADSIDSAFSDMIWETGIRRKILIGTLRGVIGRHSRSSRMTRKAYRAKRQSIMA